MIVGNITDSPENLSNEKQSSRIGDSLDVVFHDDIVAGLRDNRYWQGSFFSKRICGEV